MKRTYVHEKEERGRIDVCPACGSAEVSREDYGYDGKEGKLYWEAYECRECGQEYVDVFDYKHTEYTKEIKA